MIKVFMILLYLMRGEVVFVKTEMKDMPSCVEATKQKVAEVSKHPQFEEGLWAGCVVQKADRI